MMTPEQIRKARKTLGLTQAEFAEKLGLGAHGGRTVRRWEAGERTITRRTELMVRVLLEEEGE